MILKWFFLLNAHCWVLCPMVPANMFLKTCLQHNYLDVNLYPFQSYFMLLDIPIFLKSFNCCMNVWIMNGCHWKVYKISLKPYVNVLFCTKVLLDFTLDREVFQSNTFNRKQNHCSCVAFFALIGHVWIVYSLIDVHDEWTMCWYLLECPPTCRLSGELFVLSWEVVKSRNLNQRQVHYIMKSYYFPMHLDVFIELHV